MGINASNTVSVMIALNKNIATYCTIQRRAERSILDKEGRTAFIEYPFYQGAYANEDRHTTADVRGCDRLRGRR